MTEPTKRDDRDVLDALFAQAQDAAPAPSDTLMARIAADAAQVQTAATSQKAVPDTVPGLATRLRRALGGWTGIGGLTTATMAGLFLGFSQPSLIGITSLAATDVSIEAGEDWADAELWPGDDLFFEEG